jgi:hypothetical protein
MKVKAKFKCASVTENEYNKTVQLNAIYGTEGENADFTKATPWGELKMNIDKEVPASDFFKPGEVVYLTFEKA